MPYTAVVFGGECSDAEIKKHQENLDGANVILGIAEVSDERLLEAAALSCAEDDTMGNMPFEVSAQDVFAAMKTADKFSRNLR